MALVAVASPEVQLGGSNWPSVAVQVVVFRDDTKVNAAGNIEQVFAQLLLVRRGTGGQGTFNNNGVGSASVVVDGVTRYSSSGISYDFRGSSGMGSPGATRKLWEGWVSVPHNPDGSKTLTFSGSWSGDSILGAGSVSGSVVLPKITIPPEAPVNLTAVRLSDTQIKLSWQNNNPGHGLPTFVIVRHRVNNSGWGDVASISPTTSVVVATTSNRKTDYHLQAFNSVGASGGSNVSAPVFTTPTAPVNVQATKNAALNIVISWTPKVGYSEHVHIIEHSNNGGATWGWVTNVPAGQTSFTHVNPDPATTHRYRVASRSTVNAPLTSGWVSSQTVQLLTAPNKPGLTAPQYADKTKPFNLTWSHNPQDTTSQTGYSAQYSTNGGASWVWVVTSDKITSPTNSHTFPANTWQPNQQVMFRVRTWGQHGAPSPWSDPATTSFQTPPVTTILTPTSGSIYAQALLTVNLGFTGSAGANFVFGQITLRQNGNVVEHKTVNILTGITFATPVVNGQTYTLAAVTGDSYGLISPITVNTFSVSYTPPVTPTVTFTYLEETGIAQIDLLFPQPGVGETEAATVTITRTINGDTETVAEKYPTSSALTILDTTPTIHGTNSYTVTAFSNDGATATTQGEIITVEPWRSFLSTGAGFTNIVFFGGDLKTTAAPTRAMALVNTAGRAKPIALFGENIGLQISGSSLLVAELSSTPLEVEKFLQTAGMVCYRDPTGRRIFGTVTGQVDTQSSLSSDFTFTITEAT